MDEETKKSITFYTNARHFRKANIPRDTTRTSPGWKMILMPVDGGG